MNKDQVEGKMEQAVGKVKKGIGEVLGNQDMANRGVVNQATGAAKETWGNAKDAAKQIHNGRIPGNPAKHSADRIERYSRVCWLDAGL